MTESSIEILLVEDNPQDVKLALHAFKKHKLANHIQVARDGAEAVHFLFGTGPYEGRDISRRPKVVLLDLKLPFLDGIEVLQRIRSDPRTLTLPVVVLTSSAEEPDIAKCYQLGVNSYIVKPVDFDQFIDVSRQLGLYWLLLNQLPAP
ncbi:MAG TPA: response regulator [Gemmataceae bacterium]|nr:response regulator [Gemmataceae bacterium]